MTHHDILLQFKNYTRLDLYTDDSNFLISIAYKIAERYRKDDEIFLYSNDNEVITIIDTDKFNFEFKNNIIKAILRGEKDDKN